MKDKHFVLLEISGEYGNLEKYKKSLCEASLLGIDRVIFACVWDDSTENGKVLLEEIQEECKRLNILPLDFTMGYDSCMHDQAMVGELRKEKHHLIPNFGSMIPMDEYKSAKRGVVFEGTEKELCEYSNKKREIYYKKMYKKFGE